MLDSEEALYRVAWYYYNDNLTQSEISKLLQTSRASVGRMLEQARRIGLVKITLAPSVRQTMGTGLELITRFGLDDAVVLPPAAQAVESTQELTQRLALAGGQFLAARLKPGESVAVGWGNTVSRSLLSLDRAVLAKVHVFTLTGGVDPYLRALFNEASDGIGEYQSHTNMIPAPMLASSPTLAQALREESTVRLALEGALLAAHAVVGIGSTSKNPTITDLGYQTEAELEMHAKAGIVGDILGQFFYANGTVADLAIHRRVIGTSLSELREMPDVIAIAGGPEKAAAITAALRGGYLNVLITDLTTAHLILQLSLDSPAESADLTR